METLQTSQQTVHASQQTNGLPKVTIQAVTSKKQLAQFIDFPHDLYRNDVNYVPELFIAQRDLLTPGKHPFHEHSQLQAFLAFRGKEIVGRIAAIDNKNANIFNKTNDGFFGFFDCINDKEVSQALFNAATQWLKERKLSTMIGPVNFSTNEACGLLIEGFDGPPVVMMTYNYPYYVKLIEEAGLGTKITMYAWKIIPQYMNDRPFRVMEVLKERIMTRRNITFRKVNMKNFEEEVKGIHAIYNSAWDKNLGFVPMTEAEFMYLAKDLKMILDPDFGIVAEENGKLVGFALAIPDINQVLIKIKRGRLFPTGIVKLLLGKKKVNGLRILALGVLESHRKLGIDACFYGELMKVGRAKGVAYGEGSWILETNELMNAAMRGINADRYRTYRIYEKEI
jgi:GNAT superfamily N-acetyltransferase